MRTTYTRLLVAAILAVISMPVMADEYVLVAGGTFRMGSESATDNEQLIHEVTLSSFYIGKYEVTQTQWRETMGTDPSLFKGDSLPVERVNWYDAIAFCNALSESEGLTPAYSGSDDSISCDFTADGYRLPTEAEWEYAARGGAKSRRYEYSGSNSAGNAAWYSDNSDRKTHEAGSKAANELGLFDMSGNVREWCWDWYSGSYYATSPSTDPTGPVEGAYRVLRGGSWFGKEDNLDVADRKFRRYPSRKDADFGFRIVRSAE